MVCGASGLSVSRIKIPLNAQERRDYAGRSDPEGGTRGGGWRESDGAAVECALAQCRVLHVDTHVEAPDPDDRARYYNATANGLLAGVAHPADAWGWAIGAGVQVNLKPAYWMKARAK
jgi:hypothetical protein